MGQVCRKHEEYYEENCRWCEPAKAVEAPAAPPVPTSAQWGGNLNNQATAQQNATAANAAPSFWGFVPHDYDSNYVCGRCAHHFIQNGQPSCPVTP